MERMSLVFGVLSVMLVLFVRSSARRTPSRENVGLNIYETLIQQIYAGTHPVLAKAKRHTLGTGPGATGLKLACSRI